MKLSSLLSLWNKSIELGMSALNASYALKEDDYGLTVWKSVKPYLADDNVNQKWIIKPKKYLTIIDKDESKEVQMVKIMGMKLDNKVNLNHFFIQHFRIPLLNDPTLRRIMQLAYNVGQLKASIDAHHNKGKNDFNKAYKNYYKLNLNKLETYIDIESYPTEGIEEAIKVVKNKIKELKKLLKENTMTGGSNNWIKIYKKILSRL